ncbi:hypothetical protein [Arcticibacter sp.]
MTIYEKIPPTVGMTKETGGMMKGMVGMMEGMGQMMVKWEIPGIGY